MLFSPLRVYCVQCTETQNATKESVVVYWKYSSHIQADRHTEEHMLCCLLCLLLWCLYGGGLVAVGCSSHSMRRYCGRSRFFSTTTLRMQTTHYMTVVVVAGVCACATLVSHVAHSSHVFDAMSSRILEDDNSIAACGVRSKYGADNTCFCVCVSVCSKRVHFCSLFFLEETNKKLNSLFHRSRRHRLPQMDVFVCASATQLHCIHYPPEHSLTKQYGIHVCFKMRAKTGWVLCQ